MNNQPGLVNISLSKTIESVLNTAIRLDEQQGQAFVALEDKVIQITLAPVQTPLYFMFTHYMVSVQNHLTGEADAVIESNLLDFMTLPMTRQLPHTLVSGEPEIANQFITALCGLDIDWEEHLSHYTGDLLAFKIGHGLRQFIQGKQASKQSLGETLKEYLQFELNTLPTQSQVNRFKAQVTETQAEVDRLAERIKAL
ncbi:MAG: hypothetical protein GXO35_00910 [Gammaproteobacteria bacterium]|nr:hypothetical protein [Gammaproteobacteria bacterium]